MATYKVLQDIEAEDKLIAWLTPRQTIYAGIVIVSGVLAWAMSSVSMFLVIPWLFPILMFGFLAAPLGKDQPNDIWLAAQIRFFIKNRKRIWDQAGMQELVHITAPKRNDRIYTNGLSQTEVSSRLKALSSTIDSRGWAVKNINLNLGTGPAFMGNTTDDRLIEVNNMPQEVSNVEVNAADDILDPMSNMIAQRFDTEIKRQANEHKKQLRTITQKAAAEATDNKQQDYYFLREQELARADANGMPLSTFTPQVVAPGQPAQSATFLGATPAPVGADEVELLNKLHHDEAVRRNIAASGHEKHIKTASEIAAEERAAAQIKQQLYAQQIEQQQLEQQRLVEQQKTMQTDAEKTAPAAIIKELSQVTGFSVATIQAQAKRKADDALHDGIEISLH